MSGHFVSSTIRMTDRCKSLTSLKNIKKIILDSKEFEGAYQASLPVCLLTVGKDERKRGLPTHTLIPKSPHPLITTWNKLPEYLSVNVLPNVPLPPVGGTAVFFPQRSSHHVS
ncbi:hypothetical protein [Caudoviricetes sp.]|nr:hypothetical protein [Caudoviricetes sp.]UOF79161.1 hypothetical protein [Caudoviricetes sp.]